MRERLTAIAEPFGHPDDGCGMIPHLNRWMENWNDERYEKRCSQS